MDLKLNNEKFSVETVENNGQLTVNINGETEKYSIRDISNNITSFFINNKYQNVYTADDEKHIYVGFDGDNYVFDKIFDEEKSFDGGDTTNSENRQEVLPPMPGSIVKILVEKNQDVSEGDTLIIVEAMKMETSLYASLNGKVTQINVEAGQQVDSDTVLVVIEKE
jgi:acetyl/propionyl-CoA carboxylase alpha subunit